MARGLPGLVALAALLALAAPPAASRNLSKELARLHREGSTGGGTWAVVVRPLGPEKPGKRTFAAQAEERLLGASVCKLFTCYAAANALSLDSGFTTDVRGTGARAGHVLAGDLWLTGRGAPGIRSVAAAPEDSSAWVLERLAHLLRADGIDSVTGRVRVDDRFFEAADSLGRGWQWDDLPWWYGAPVTATAVDDNALAVFFHVRPDGHVEAEPIPLPAGWGGTSEVALAAEGAPTDITVRWADARHFVLGGRLARGDDGHRESLAVPRPALYAAARFQEALARAGVRVAGGGFTVDPAGGAEAAAPSALVAIFSPTLRQAFLEILAHSQNLEAEMVLRDLGAAREGAPGSVAKGLREVARALEPLGIGPAQVRLVDGCGLSRMDYITAEAVARVLERAAERAQAGDPGMWALLDGLARPGQPGSLRRRFVGEGWPEPSSDWLRGKTGSMDAVDALAALVTSREGERYVVVSLRNRFPETREQARAWEERLIQLVRE